MCLLVCLLVCLLFIGHTTFVHFAALPPSGRESRISLRRERPSARWQAHARAQRKHARACRTTSQRKNRSADAFQKQNRARAYPVVYVTAEIFKRKTNMPLPKFSLQFAFFSWSVYFSNRTESYSSQIEFAGPHGITENQATYLHCGGEARAKKRARPPATCRKASTTKTGADTGPEGCGAPAVFPSPCLDLQRLQS